MRSLLAASISVAAALFVSTVLAYPDGAPWGSADPQAAENCGTCHFGAQPVLDSEAISVNGLPDRLEPGASYDLEVVFEDPAMAVAGFQMFAVAAGQEAGAFEASIDDVEIIGAAIRSIAPVKAAGAVSWALRWSASDTLPGQATIHIAATAGNDDGSPLGDVVHFRTIDLPVAR